MCKKCGKPISQLSITRSSTCEFCGADLHSCIDCKFYSPGSHYDCHETVDELVKDKDRVNFCDYFSVAKIDKIEGREDGSSQSESDKARAAFASLFG